MDVLMPTQPDAAADWGSGFGCSCLGLALLSNVDWMAEIREAVVEFVDKQEDI
jgi:hypothetical protein